MTEQNLRVVSPEESERKGKWLKDLAEFLVEANLQTWAADKGKIEATRPNSKRSVHERGNWKLDDEYDSYFKAPGSTRVFYKNVPVWSMHYGGPGMSEGYEYKVKETFHFLKGALLKVSSELPYRGPEEYSEGTKTYKFRVTRGDLEDCSWEEEIFDGDILLFKQIGFAGTSVGKDENRQPVYPWNL